MDPIRHALQTVDSIINGTRFYTEDENDQYIRPYLTEEDGTHFKINGKKFDRYGFLASFAKMKAPSFKRTLMTSHTNHGWATS
jgi:hypothetical protein